MPVDPEECRKHALFRTELAAAARTTRSKALFLELSQSWEKLAIQLEDAITENEDIRSYVRELHTHGEMTGPEERYVGASGRRPGWATMRACHRLTISSSR
jgi:hypothetical protein